VAKALDWDALDGDGRKPGERTGLDTRVVLCCKQCGLGVGPATSWVSAEGKPLNPPPGEYGRKAEIKANALGATEHLKELAGEHHKG
jgi:hypothetical protein